MSTEKNSSIQSLPASATSLRRRSDGAPFGVYEVGAAGGTFWQTIVDFTPDHVRLLRPKCSTINEAYDFGARL